MDVLKKNAKKYKVGIIILLLYFLLSLIMTYPLILNFTTSVPGDNYDTWVFIWNFWWVKKVLTEPNLNLYYTNYQYYPNGSSLAFHTLSLFNSFLSLPMQLISNIVISYNIIFLLSFILSSYGMFLLINYLIKDKKIAFISGIAFAFCPYHFGHALGHLNLLSIEWIPFYVLFFIKIFQENKKSNSILTGIFLSINSLTDWQYGIFLIIFSILYLIYRYLIERNIKFDRSLLSKLALFSMIFILITLPFVFPLISDSRQYSFIFKSEDMQPYFYIIPNFMNPLWGNFFHYLLPNVGFAENMMFLGYTIIFITLIGIRRTFKKTKFWIISLIFFFLISLNPRLDLFGIKFMSPLYSLFYYLFPFFSYISIVNRFSILVMFSLIVIFSFALENIMKKFKGNFHGFPKDMIYYIISILILVEFLSIPYPLSNAKIPEVAYEIKNQSTTILNLPFSPNPYSLYLQTVHEKKLLNGYISRPQNSSMDLLNNIHNLLISGKFQDVSDILSFYNVKYITLDKNSNWNDFMNKNFSKFLSSIIIGKTYEDENLMVFKTLPYNETRFSDLNISFYENFYDEEQKGEMRWRWMSQDGIMRLYSENDSNTNFIIWLQAFYKKRTVDVFLNDKIIQTSNIANGFNFIQISLNLKKGENSLLFHSRERCEAPINYSLSDDERCLSVLFVTSSL